MSSAACRLALGLGVAIAAFAVLAPSRLAFARDVVEARRLFAEGVKLFQRGDHEGARRLFKQADAEHHAPPIVYNLGLAEERLGHPQAAVDAFEAYVAEVGEAGELSASAAVAIAQVKARSTRLRIDSKPSGARLFVDGAVLAEPTPTSILVAAGHHVIVAQGDTWRLEQDVETRGAGDVLSVLLVRSEPEPSVRDPGPQAVDLVPSHARPPQRTKAPADAAPTDRPDGLVLGAAFAIAPYFLRGIDSPGASNAEDAHSVIAGAILEGGVALTDRFEFLARGYAALGPDGKPTYAYMGGPGVSLRVGSSVWLGGTFIGGQLETRAHDARYGTDLVFGAMAEIGIVILHKPEGQWMVSTQPGLLLTEQRHDNSAIFIPISFGYRGY